MIDAIDHVRLSQATDKEEIRRLVMPSLITMLTNMVGFFGTVWLRADDSLLVTADTGEYERSLVLDGKTVKLNKFDSATVANLSCLGNSCQSACKFGCGCGCIYDLGYKLPYVGCGDKVAKHCITEYPTRDTTGLPMYYPHGGCDD